MNLDNSVYTACSDNIKYLTQSDQNTVSADPHNSYYPGIIYFILVFYVGKLKDFWQIKQNKQKTYHPTLESVISNQKIA